MSQRDHDDETLMAFADGELDPAAAADLERLMAADPDLAARVDAFRQIRGFAKSALDPMLETPVPDDLAVAVEAMLAEGAASESPGDDNVVPLHRSAEPTAARHWLPALAASLALVVGALGGYILGTSTQDGGGDQIADINQPGLMQALETVPSGAESSLPESGGRFRAIASFRNAEGALCREFEVDGGDRSTTVSVACHTDRAWKLRFAVAATGGQEGYAPASSLEALDAYLRAVGAGEPMTISDETAALAALN